MTRTRNKDLDIWGWVKWGRIIHSPAILGPGYHPGARVLTKIAKGFCSDFYPHFSDISSFCEYLPVVVFASQGFCSKFLVDDLY